MVLAAGRADRFGGAKQFRTLGGRRLVDRAVDTATAVCDAVVVVLPAGVTWDGAPVATSVAGGWTRSGSVRRALAVVPASAEVIVVHDASHPLASEDLMGTVVARVRAGAPAAVPVLPLEEVVKQVRAGRVVGTVGRDGLGLAQTPYAFRAEVLRAAHRRGDEAREDSELVERLGYEVATVPGDPVNVHVVTPRDLHLAERLLG